MRWTQAASRARARPATTTARPGIPVGAHTAWSGSAIGMEAVVDGKRVADGPRQGADFATNP